MTEERVKRIRYLLTHEQWSPQQIAAIIRDKDKVSICHETIYRYVWQDKKQGGTLYTHLRQRGRKHNKRGSTHAGRGVIPHRRDISERPQIVDAKTRLGDVALTCGRATSS